MKRFHVHVAVEDIEQNVRFYSTVFGDGTLAAQSEKSGIKAACCAPA
jgi:predicted enzyme related to lactoylglutathione lyase